MWRYILLIAVMIIGSSALLFVLGLMPLELFKDVAQKTAAATGVLLVIAGFSALLGSSRK